LQPLVHIVPATPTDPDVDFISLLPA
jgi:hypothetical protein